MPRSRPLLSILRFGSRVGALVCLFACLPACNQPDYLEIDPKEFNFKRRGEKVWARVIAKNRQGHTFPGHKASWKTSDPTVVSVDETGHVASVGPGRATLTAVSGKMEAEAIVEVVTVERITVEPMQLDLDMESGSRVVVVKAFDHQGRELADRKPASRCESDKVCTATDSSVFPSNPGKTTLTVSVEGQKVEVPVTVVEKAPKKK
jgi:hypothetical protein